MNSDHIPDRNEDPITGAPGSHPLGVGVGTAGGAATGATIGAVGGPVGAVVGAVVGGIAGAFAGKGVAEMIDPTEEGNYWRENHSNQEWAGDPDNTYDDYEPAYRFGYTRAAESGFLFDENDSDLEKDWEQFKGKSRLEWEQAKNATRAGWHRVVPNRPGEPSRAGV